MGLCKNQIEWKTYKTAPVSAREKLRSSEEKSFFIHLAAENMSGPNNNFFAFSSEGGFFNKGLSWHHARFQRNSLYLALFRPDKPQLSYEEAKRVVRQLRQGRKVVEINGYENFYEFSHVYKKLIQNELESWKLKDMLLGQWILENVGSYEVSPERLKSLMDDIYNEVHCNKMISFVQLQIEGFLPHAWLITEMKKFEGGYIFKYIDSNTAESRNPDTGFYKEGDTSLRIYGVKCVPYLRFKTDMMYIINALNSYITSWNEHDMCNKLQLHYL